MQLQATAKIKTENEKRGGYKEFCIKLEVDDGVSIDVLVAKPVSCEKLAAYVFAHGGGGVIGSARMMQNQCVKWALDRQVIVFNVDYRLAPEHKLPIGPLDFHKAIKHVIDNASELGVDPSKITIGGESAGGLMAAGAAYQLAIDDESHLIHSMWLTNPALSNEIARMPFELLNSYEKALYEFCQGCYVMFAIDLEKQSADPFLHPGRMPFEVLKKLPPTVIMTGEFDMLRRDAIEMIARCEEAGVLLDYFSMPGANHIAEGFDDAVSRTLYKEKTAAWCQHVYGG